MEKVIDFTLVSQAASDYKIPDYPGFESGHFICFCACSCHGRDDRATNSGALE